MRRSFARLGLLTAALALGGTPQALPAQQGSNNVRTVNKDAIKEDITPTRPVMVRNAFGGFGNVSHKASRMLNQRQYRKLVKQNPNIYRSKKHRSKN